MPYYYYKAPKIVDLAPGEGPTEGGTTVKIFAPETHPFNMHKHLISHWFLKPTVPLNDTTPIANTTWEDLKPEIPKLLDPLEEAPEKVLPFYPKLNKTEK